MKDRSILEGKSLEDLRYIAKMLGVKNLTRLKKSDLIDLITKAGEVPATEPSTSTSKIETSADEKADKPPTEASIESKRKRGRPKLSLEKKASDASIQEPTIISKDATVPPAAVSETEPLTDSENVPEGIAAEQPFKARRGRPKKIMDLDINPIKELNTAEHDEPVKTLKPQHIEKVSPSLDKEVPNKSISAPDLNKPVEFIKPIVIENSIAPNITVAPQDSEKPTAPILESTAVEEPKTSNTLAENDESDETNNETDREKNESNATGDNRSFKYSRSKDLSRLESDTPVSGILEVLPDGYGFLRKEMFISSDNDISMFLLLKFEGLISKPVIN